MHSVQTLVVKVTHQASELRYLAKVKLIKIVVIEA